MLFGFWEERRLCEGSVKPFVGFTFAAWAMERRGVVVRKARRIIKGECSAPRAMVVRNIFARRKCLEDSSGMSRCSCRTNTIGDSACRLLALCTRDLLRFSKGFWKKSAPNSSSLSGASVPPRYQAPFASGWWPERKSRFRI
jgi:hypothetical protein